MSEAPVLEISDVHTSFGLNKIHKGVSFEVEKGTIVALIGGSGSGKSVLLRAIIGLLEADQGSIKLFGTDITGISEQGFNRLRNRFGVLFQNGALFSALSVAENVAVPLKEQMELAEDAVSDVVALRLALSGLPLDAGTKMPSELSGGMRKRAALARALALEPELLFLDEPTSGLDPINARAFDQLIRTLARALKITVLIITHDLDTIEGIVDRVLVLDQGKIIADGPPAEVSKVSHPWIQEYFTSRVQTKNG
ncbi:MAG: ATP-binding cassette domain-containing protein [Deltaproteobacteria bacterium]|nr:ATP-binding cassette domain-containing protein [Deltaproteobacteria bacterium]